MEQENSDASNLSKESSESKDICSNGISILQLNNDCLMHIFSFVPLMDRIELEKVCKHWKIVSETSWSNVKRLSLENWSSIYTSPFILNYSRLNKILSLCGSYLTHIEFEKSVDFKKGGPHSVLRKISGDEKFFKTLKKWCPKLQSINITRLDMSSKGIEYLAENLKVKELCFGNLAQNLQSSISYLFKINSNLESLSLYSRHYTGVGYLSHLPIELKKFHFGINHPDDSTDITHFYHRLQYLRNLHDLSLNCNIIDVKKILEIISTNGSLIEKLSLTRIVVNIKTCDFTDLACLKNLQYLKLEGGISSIFYNNDKLSTVAARRLPILELETIMRLPKLRWLKLSYIQINMNQIIHIQSNLQSITFDNCFKITKEGLSLSLQNTNDTLELNDCLTHKIYIEVTNKPLTLAVGLYE